jgi:DNA-binding MarR family transcriptional regulator
LEQGLLEAQPDPDDGRARRLVLGAPGQALVHDAVSALDELWKVLERRLGAPAAADLRTVLGSDWGTPPTI